MIVMKYGGSSIKDATMFKQVASIVKKQLDQEPIVILSAIKGTTDSLIAAMDESINQKYDSYELIVSNHSQILKDLELNEDIVTSELDELKETLEVISRTKEKSKKLVDYVSFFGERMSVKILAAYLNKIEIKSESFISGEIGLITDSNFGCASILKSSFEKMNEEISKIKGVPIITGFGGKDEQGEFTTFARGGSDYVAALFGAAVDAKEIQIWTDVNGIMTCDPRIVKDAKTIPVLTFNEASELAYFGAKVLHPKTIWPAIKKNIPVLVLNTYEPEHPGSKIVSQVENKNKVTALTYKKNITIINAKSTRMINAHGYLARIFEVFGKYKKPVDMISTSEVDVSMSVDNKSDIDWITRDLADIAKINTHENKAIINVVGENMPQSVGLASKIFSIMSTNGINIEMISACYDGISVGFVVKQEKAEEAIKALHKELIQ